MNKAHLRDMELACLSDGEFSTEAAEHLRWCTRCRNGVVDYRWLQGELAATLAAVGDAVPVSRPRWWVVQEYLFVGQRWRVAKWRASAFASIVLAVCCMLFTPVFLTAPVAAAQISQPAVATVPTPARIVVSDDCSAVTATPTPAILLEDGMSFPTPVLGLFPTPTEPGV